MIQINEFQSEYIIKWGDTLSAISIKTAISADTIAKANNISNPNLIYVGDKLVFDWNKKTVSYVTSDGKVVGTAPIEKNYFTKQAKKTKNIKEVNSTTTETIKPMESNKPVDFNNIASQTMLNLINQHRQNHGFNALVLSKRLTEATDIRAKENTHDFSHTRPNNTNWDTVLDDIDYESNARRENIAWNGYVDKSDEFIADYFFNQWKKSDRHNVNMLGSENTDVGFIFAKEGDRIYGVQIFTSGEINSKNEEVNNSTTNTVEETTIQNNQQSTTQSPSLNNDGITDSDNLSDNQ